MSGVFILRAQHFERSPHLLESQDVMHDPRACHHQWEAHGRLDIRRGTRFMLVCVPRDVRCPPAPEWTSLELELDAHTRLFIDDLDGLVSSAPGQRDEVRLIRERAGGVVLRRDGLGRSLVMGTALECGVAVGNDASWLRDHTTISSSHVCARRLAMHRRGWDRHDISAPDFLEGLWRILPGHQCHLVHGEWRQASWWAEEVCDWHAGRGHREDVDALCEVLGSAAPCRDEEVGLAVSSGLDSTLIAALCHDRGDRLVLGSMSFPGLPACDEAGRVREWNHTMGVPAASFFDMTQVSPWGGDAGRFDVLGPQSHPGERYERVFASRFASAHELDAIMTGVGADQLFEVSPLHVIEDLVRRERWDELMRPHWRARLGRGGVPGAWWRHHLRETWRELAPEAWHMERLRSQLLVDPLSTPCDDTWTDELARSLLDRDEVWGENAHSVARRRWLKSWEWEGLMRALWRLERASGVRIHTPYLDEAVWRWGVWLSPQARLDGFGGRTYSKFLLRRAHARFAHLFPEGFARRGKAAVFDEHIRQGMIGADRQLVRDVLEHIPHDAARHHAQSLWRRVEAGAIGAPLVELCRIFAAERWRQTIER